jgi:peptide deformylase
MILDIVRNDPVLYQPTAKFDFANPQVDPIQLAVDLAETMLDEGGLGLSANQCGIPLSAFVMKGEQIIAVFNPIIVDRSEDLVSLDEGCLSFPKLILKIKRPSVIKVRYTEPNGNVVTTKFQGITARVFQHEMQHLSGEVFTRSATPFELERGRAKQKQSLRHK